MTGAMVTSLTPVAAGVVVAAALAGMGTLSGTDCFGFVIVGSPLLAALLTSGSALQEFSGAGESNPAWLRFSASHFIRATAFGSASGIAISSSFSRFFAGST